MKKTKGERLGWQHVSEVKPVKLADILKPGILVNHRCEWEWETEDILICTICGGLRDSDGFDLEEYEEDEGY